jgi:hypothetical protein
MMVWSKHEDLEGVLGVLEALRSIVDERKYEQHVPALLPGVESVRPLKVEGKVEGVVPVV